MSSSVSRFRDVLWLTALVAMGLAWFVSHGNAQKTIRNMDNQMRHFAQELAIVINQNVHISNESGEYKITPVCAACPVACHIPRPFHHQRKAIQSEESDVPFHDPRCAVVDGGGGDGRGGSVNIGILVLK